MEIRELDVMEAERLVLMIRKEAKLTPQESRFLTMKMESPVYNFNDLPKPLMEKLRTACKKLNITYRGESL